MTKGPQLSKISQINRAISASFARSPACDEAEIAHTRDIERQRQANQRPDSIGRFRVKSHRLLDLTPEEQVTLSALIVAC
jgi:hypothetical protein